MLESAIDGLAHPIIAATRPLTARGLNPLPTTARYGGLGHALSRATGPPMALNRPMVAPVA